MLIATLVAVAIAQRADAQGRDFSIGYHERVALPRTGAPHLSFIAHGRQFDLELIPNNGIVALPEETTAGRVAMYRGRLSGQADSWARITETGGAFSGAIWDGTELWLLDSHADVSGYFVDPATTRDDATIMFRLSEVSGTFGDIAVSDYIETAVDDTRQPSPLLPFIPTVTQPVQPGRVIDVALIASADFRERHGGAAEDVLLAMFNIVEGVFLTQVGVQLRVAELTVYESDVLGLRGTDAELLLESFGSYKARNRDLRDLGLAHLFVSRDLDDTNPPVRTVGIANIGTICSEHYGVGVTEAASSIVFDALITAHEIGHNFGAPHDGETGSACAWESPNHIMGAKIGAGASFSQCSLVQMRQQIAAASCMRDMVPADAQLRLATALPSTVRVEETFGIDLVLANLSNTPVAGLTLEATATGLSTPMLPRTLPGEGQCERGETLNCAWPWFDAGTSTTLRLSVTGQSPGAGTINISIGSLNELDASDNALDLDIEVLPRNVLAGRLSPSELRLQPGETARLSAGVANYSEGSVTNVLAQIESSGDALEIIEVALPNCAPDEQSGSQTCSVGTLGPRSLRNFSVTVRALDEADAGGLNLSGNAGISLRSTADELTQNPAHIVRATVAIGAATAGQAEEPAQQPLPDAVAAGEPETASTPKSGGGAMGLPGIVLLTALCVGIAARRRRRRQLSI